MEMGGGLRDSPDRVSCTHEAKGIGKEGIKE